MDKSIPAGAARLLDLIGSVEAPHGYNTIFRNLQGQLSKPVTTMTVDEMIAGKSVVDPRSSATGRYQFMRDTMRSLKVALKLSGSEVLTPDFQDRLAYELVKRRGYYSFLIGRKSLADFGKALAQEWASFPVLSDTQGPHGFVKRGHSYYSGDGLNASLLTPERIEAVLKYALETDMSKPQETPVPVIAPPVTPIPVPVPVNPTPKPWYASQTLIGIAITLLTPYLGKVIPGWANIDPNTAGDLVVKAVENLGPIVGAIVAVHGRLQTTQPIAGTQAAIVAQTAQSQQQAIVDTLQAHVDATLQQPVVPEEVNIEELSLTKLAVGIPRVVETIVSMIPSLREFSKILSTVEDMNKRLPPPSGNT
jgi:muramidase (phage lysozyme)